MRLEIWDTAGMEKFHSLTPMYYRGAHGALVVFDLTSARSYAGMKAWVQALEESGPDGVAVVMCGNKADLVDADDESREAEYEVAAQYAKEIGAAYFETSAKTGDNVGEAFTHLVNELWDRRRAQAGESDTEDERARKESVALDGDRDGMSRDASGSGSTRGGGAGCCS
jgi:small GTP-binding protein